MVPNNYIDFDITISLKKNTREYRRGNQKKKLATQDKEILNKNTTQYMLDTTIHKQTQIT